MSVECWASRHAHRRLEDIAYLRLYYESPEVERQHPRELARPVQGPAGDGRRQPKMVVFDDLATEERIRVHDKGVARARRPLATSARPPMSYRYGDVVAPYLVVNEPLSDRGRALRRLRADRDAAAHRTATNGLAVVEVLEAAQLSCASSDAAVASSPRSRGRPRRARELRDPAPGGSRSASRERAVSRPDRHAEHAAPCPSST